MRTYSLLLASLFAGVAFSQTPDCLPGSFTFTSGAGSGPPTLGYFDNRTLQCQTWTVGYESDGNVTGATIAFQAATGTNAPGTFATLTPIASTPSFGTSQYGTATYNVLSSTLGSSTPNPWTRVLISGGTGTGTIRVSMYGYRTGPTGGTGGGGGGGGGSGCSSPCPVTQSTVPWQDLLVGASAFASGQASVTGTAAALATHAAKFVCVKALIGNTINVYVGATGVTTSTGMELTPGQPICQYVSNTNLVFVVASTTGASVAYTYTN